MRLDARVIDELTVAPGSRAGLRGRSTSRTQTDWLGPLGQGRKGDAEELDLEVFKEELDEAQETLYADASFALLILFQGLDASGKDGTIKHVMSGLNPQGCSVASFKQPSAEELRHDFLWRAGRALPERGRIAIFNRSYYEDVLVTRVHPELLEGQLLPGEAPGNRLWHERYEDINAFERHLTRCGTRVVKLFLHLSKDEQRRRLLERLDNPRKQWKFSPADLSERSRFDSYEEAYEDAITATSTAWAPWYVVPADRKGALRALVAGIVVHAIAQLHLRPPAPSEADREELDRARRALEAEE